MKYLLDTNVLSESRKADCDANVKAWLQSVDGRNHAISAISIGELTKGVTRLPDGFRRRELQKWLDEVEITFVDRVIDVNADIARLWGLLTTTAARQGKTLPMADGLIAATAIDNDLCLVTRNVSDVEFTGVELINPWIA